MVQRPRSPKIARALLARLDVYQRNHSILEDFDETFSDLLLSGSGFKARCWYWKSTLMTLAAYLRFILAWKFHMFMNHLTIAYRNFVRHKVFSFINVFGLAVSMACGIIVFLYVAQETSYDDFHAKKDLIYRLAAEKNVRNTWYFSPRAPSPAGAKLKELFPEVQDYTIFAESGTPCIIEKEGELFRTIEERIVNESFFEIFTFPFRSGDPATALRDPSSIVVTESFALRWFGTADALGRVLKIQGQDRIVSGVLKDIPRNSHLRFGFLVPLTWYLQNQTGWKESFSSIWGGMGVPVYLLMKRKVSVEEFNRKIRDIVPRNDAEPALRLFLQTLNKVYLHSDMLMEEHEAEENSDMTVGSLKNLRLLVAAAVVLMLIAGLNYANLSTAVVARRAKEVGLRKVCGSQRKDLIRQFLGESLSLSFLAAIGALLLVALFLPAFNRYSGKTIGFQDLGNVGIIAGVLGMTVLTGFLSGCYPAFYLSSVPAVNLFKNGAPPGGKSKVSFRHVMVVVQFALTITTIIGTTVFSRQFRFTQDQFRDFGLDNTLVVIDWAFARHHEEAKRDLLQSPHILSVSQSATPGAALSPSSDVSWPGKDRLDAQAFFHARIDYDYLDVMKPRIVAGRFFSQEIASDASGFLVNETAVRVMGMASPLGKVISFKGKEGPIIGVVEDRPFASLRYRIPPMVYEINHNYPHFNIKVDRPENIAAAIDHINRVRKTYPDYRPVSYWLAGDQIARYMKEERTLSDVFSYVSGLTLIIAGLGLFGLSLFHVTQKTKEIGIRKVLGSTSPQIANLLVREFIKWVLLANIIAWPVAYFLMKRWLQSYVYRVDMGLLTFVIAGATALAVALITIAYHSIKAATANPVDSLRYE